VCLRLSPPPPRGKQRPFAARARVSRLCVQERAFLCVARIAHRRPADCRERFSQLANLNDTPGGECANERTNGPARAKAKSEHQLTTDATAADFLGARSDPHTPSTGPRANTMGRLGARGGRSRQPNVSRFRPSSALVHAFSVRPPDYRYRYAPVSASDRASHSTQHHRPPASS
jgi:hypothetical protein